MKRKLYFMVIVIVVITGFCSIYVTQNEKAVLSSVALANIEALANNESSMWFSNLRWVECPIKKVNGPVGIYIKGVWIAGYATYEIMGSKRSCVRELTTNTCYLSDETPCRENN